MQSLRTAANNLRRATKWEIQERDRQLRQMAVGPTIAADKCTILIPSVWYKMEAAEFWSKQGFNFISGLLRWERDSRQAAADGKIYSAAAWLKATRQKYYDEFWPTLKKICPSCGQTFIPHSYYEIECPSCAHSKKGQNDG